MNTTPKRPLNKIHLPLFWRLFLSLLAMIVITSTLSITVERWLNEKELSTRMEIQIESLLIKRQQVIVLLNQGDIETVRRMYRQNRRLMNQMRIYNEQGNLVFPRYQNRKKNPDSIKTNNYQASRSIDTESLSANPVKSSNYDNTSKEDDLSMTPFTFNDFIDPSPRHKMTAGIDDRPELADISVDLPDGQTMVLQLRPQLPFREVIALQRGNFPVRLLLIILFSVLVCYWLSRTMTKRIQRVQQTVHRLLVGDYQTPSNLVELGSDELGSLAKDVAQLATRLAASELARKQMLSDISHELRSPLARLEVATELTRDFAPTASRYLDRIDKESARMNELIEQIIRIQSLQMQQYAINNNGIETGQETVNMIDLLNDIGQDVCFEFQNKNVEWQLIENRQISVTTTSDYWSLLGNQDQLHSALENVIRNAFMHTLPESTVSAEVLKVKDGFESEIESGIEAIQISITDEGGGVADEDLERMFQPFVRLDSARNRKTGGYGLGLAIVHAVILAHKGQIQVHNRKEGIKGLIVQITLPVL